MEMLGFPMNEEECEVRKVGIPASWREIRDLTLIEILFLKNLIKNWYFVKCMICFTEAASRTKSNTHICQEGNFIEISILAD
jgi:hypothetical protein